MLCFGYHFIIYGYDILSSLSSSSLLSILLLLSIIILLSGVNWKNIITVVPTVKVIIYMRTNIVKIAVSGHRGKAMKQACGNSNIKQLSVSKCVIPPTVNWTVAQFSNEVGYW